MIFPCLPNTPEHIVRGKVVYLDAATYHVACQWARAQFGAAVEVLQAIDAAPEGAMVHDVPTPPTAIELAAQYVERERQRARREAFAEVVGLLEAQTKRTVLAILRKAAGL